MLHADGELVEKVEKLVVPVGDEHGALLADSGVAEQVEKLVVPVREERVALPADGDVVEEVELTPTEGFLLSRLDAAHDVASLIQLSSLPEDEAYSTLYTLLMSGSVIVSGDGGVAIVSGVKLPVHA